MKLIRALLLVFVAASVGFAGEDKLPDLAPQVRSVYPGGGQRGQIVEITIKGRFLNDTQQIRFSRPDLVAELSSSDFYQVRGRINIGANVPVGLHEYRLITGKGTFVGFFHVGSSSQLIETEPNNEPGKAQKVTLPVIVDGQIEDADYDLYRFHAKAGETVVIDAMAARMGSGLDAKLAVLDDRGHEVAFNEDFYPSGDPHVAFTATTEGDYIAQVSDAFESGSPFSVYRLSIGIQPQIYAALPAAAPAGRATEIELRGVNLDKVKEIALGDSALRGEILNQTNNRMTVRLSPDKPVKTFLRINAEAGVPLVSFPFEISKLEEKRSAGASRQDPENIEPGIAVTGILEGKRPAHFYSIDVKAGERIAFQVGSANFGYLLDPAIAIYDPAGKEIGFQDDPFELSVRQPVLSDPYLVQKFEAAGRYVIKVRDTGERGDPHFVYRMTVKKAEPDFELQFMQVTQTLYRERPNKVTVRVRRVDGWDAPVEVWLDEPPAGITAAKHTAEPKNSVYKDCMAIDQIVDGTDIEFETTVAADVYPGAIPLRFRARGTFEGKSVEHTLKVMFYSSNVVAPSDLGDLHAYISDLPPMVIDTPQNFSVFAGKSTKLTLNAQRFDQAKDPIKIELVPATTGITMENNVLAPGIGQVEIQFKASAETKAGTYNVVLRAGNISSPPIELKVTAPPEEKK